MQNTKKNAKTRIESNFAKTRKSIGLTQEELAIKISETRQRISAWENSKESPWMRSLFRIADKLQVSHISLIESPKSYVGESIPNAKTIMTDLHGQYDTYEVCIQFQWEEEKLYQSNHVDTVIEIDHNPYADDVLNLPVYAYRIMDEVEYNNSIASTPHNDSAYTFSNNIRILVMLVWPGDVTRKMIPMKYTNSSPFPQYE